MLLHVNYVQSTCTECMSCYIMFAMLCFGSCCVVPCPKNFSAQSDPVSSDKKRLVTCANTYSHLVGGA